MAFEEIQQTKEERTRIKVNDIIRRSNQLEKNIEKQYTELFNMIWFDKWITPHEFFTEAGSRGVKFFTDSQHLQVMLKTLNPNYQIKVPPYNFTINQDGTVTIGDLIEQ